MRSFLFHSTVQELKAWANEASQTADILLRTQDILDDLDLQFAAATGLEQTDIVFLILATGLQIARQYLLSNEKLKLQDIKKDGKVVRTSSQRGDALVESVYSNTVGLVAPPDWNDVLFQSVPYDATLKSELINYSPGLGGTTHRYRTLGHDPLLGWIFGTANIITNSLTKTDLDTFCVKEMHIMRRYLLGCVGMLQNAVSYSVNDPTLQFIQVFRGQILLIQEADDHLFHGPVKERVCQCAALRSQIIFFLHAGCIDKNTAFLFVNDHALLFQAG